MKDRPSRPFFDLTERTVPHAKGTVLLDVMYSRLYIVLHSWFADSEWLYECLIVSDWSNDGMPNHPGEIVVFHEGVENDPILGHVELGEAWS